MGTPGALKPSKATRILTGELVRDARRLASNPTEQTVALLEAAIQIALKAGLDRADLIQYLRARAPSRASQSAAEMAV